MVRILTHNAYWFQGHPSRWGEERVADVPDVLQALIRLYASVNADVICLQEVHREALTGVLAHELGMAASLYAPGGLRSEYGGIVMSRQDARLRDCTRIDGQPPFDRIHLRASLDPEGARLELAVVHLPSNRYAGSPEAGEVARMEELKRVLAGLPRPDVIVGDMNCRPDSQPYRFLVGSGYFDAAVVTGSDYARKHHVDYIWLNVEWAGRVTGFWVLDDGAFCRRTPEGESWLLSDHPPLLVELR